MILVWEINKFRKTSIENNCVSASDCEVLWAISAKETIIGRGTFSNYYGDVESIKNYVFDIIDNWIKRTGGTVLFVVHNLSLANLYNNKAVLINNVKIQSWGFIDEIFINLNLSNTYKINLEKYTENYCLHEKIS